MPRCWASGIAQIFPSTSLQKNYLFLAHNQTGPLRSTREVAEKLASSKLCPYPCRTEVKVHQLVKNRNGDILSDQTLLHVFIIANGLIERMYIGESKPACGQSHTV
jgi:hypothetical protein